MFNNASSIKADYINQKIIPATIHLDERKRTDLLKVLQENKSELYDLIKDIDETLKYTSRAGKLPIKSETTIPKMADTAMKNAEYFIDSVS
jgi:hypothetical protein